MALEDIERLKEKITRDPNSKLFVPLAEEYKKAGMYDEAIDTLARGLDQQPGYLSARVSLGKIYIERGMLTEARTEFEKVVSAIPDNLYAHKKLAEIYQELDEQDKAIQEFRKVLKLNPMDDWATTSLSELQKKQTEPKRETSMPEATESPQAEELVAAGELPEENPVPVKGNKDLWDLPSETVDTTKDEQASELPLTPRDLDITESILRAKEEGEMQEVILGEIPGSEEIADLEAIEAEVPGEISETEETGSGAALTPEEEEIDLWEEPSDATEEPLEEELSSETPMSREDLDLWKSLKEAEDEGNEPVLEAEESDEGTLSLDTILQEAEPEGGISESNKFVKEEIHEKTGDILIMADRYIGEGNYAEAMSIYRKILSSNPHNRQVLQRAEELKALLKLLGKDKEELITRLNNMLQSIQKRRDEFFGTP